MKKIRTFLVASAIMMMMATPAHAATPLYRSNIGTIMQNARTSATQAAQSIKISFKYTFK